MVCTLTRSSLPICGVFHHGCGSGVVTSVRVSLTGQSMNCPLAVGDGSPTGVAGPLSLPAAFGELFCEGVSLRQVPLNETWSDFTSFGERILISCHPSKFGSTGVISLHRSAVGLILDHLSPSHLRSEKRHADRSRASRGLLFHRRCMRREQPGYGSPVPDR